MISCVICSRSAPAFDSVSANVALTIGNVPYEMIRIDNSTNAMGICQAYNLGVEKAQGDIVVFLHEDVYHLEAGWGRVLKEKFLQNAGLGLIGVAGAQVLRSSPLVWSSIGRPWMFGKVVHELDQGQRLFLTVFDEQNGDKEVSVVDGCWFAVRKQVFQMVHFDDKNFPGFHFYDLDICAQIRLGWSLIATTDIRIKHLSGGNFGEQWKTASQVFARKWKDHLPMILPGIDFDGREGLPFFNVNLKR